MEYIAFLAVCFLIVPAILWITNAFIIKHTGKKKIIPLCLWIISCSFLILSLIKTEFDIILYIGLFLLSLPSTIIVTIQSYTIKGKGDTWLYNKYGNLIIYLIQSHKEINKTEFVNDNTDNKTKDIIFRTTMKYLLFCGKKNLNRDVYISLRDLQKYVNRFFGVSDFFYQNEKLCKYNSPLQYYKVIDPNKFGHRSEKLISFDSIIYEKQLCKLEGKLLWKETLPNGKPILNKEVFSLVLNCEKKSYYIKSFKIINK